MYVCFAKSTLNRMYNLNTHLYCAACKTRYKKCYKQANSQSDCKEAPLWNKGASKSLPYIHGNAKSKCRKAKICSTLIFWKYPNLILLYFHFDRLPFWSISILAVFHFGCISFWSSSILGKVVFHLGHTFHMIIQL